MRDFLATKEHAKDIWPDAQQCMNCAVHKGFYKVWQELRTHRYWDNNGAGGIFEELESIGCGRDSGQQVFITGHSLGGAIAALAMYDMELLGWNVGLSYTFNAPRVGNTNFAIEFEKKFALKRNVSYFRVTRLKDVVSQVPPKSFLGSDYHHVGAEAYYYPSWTMDKYVVCDDPESLECSKRYTFRSKLLGNIIHDHINSTLLQKGAFGRPQYCPLQEKQGQDEALRLFTQAVGDIDSPEIGLASSFWLGGSLGSIAAMALVVLRSRRLKTQAGDSSIELVTCEGGHS